MIFIDECVDPALGLYLIVKDLKNVICVASNNSLVGKSDEELLNYCYKHQALLITKDKEFFHTYNGPKIFISNGCHYEDVPSELQYKITNKGLDSLCDKVIELDSLRMK